MNKEIMRRHYEKTPKKTLINILISSREQVDKLQNRNKEHKQEIERLNNIINDIDRYIHNWRLEDIGEKTMLILNDILLIKNGMSDEVIRLKGSDKE